MPATCFLPATAVLGADGVARPIEAISVIGNLFETAWLPLATCWPGRGSSGLRPHQPGLDRLDARVVPAP